MNRMPVIGDVITIGRNELIVVMAGSTSLLKANMFHTIKRDDLGKVNPKQSYYYVAIGIDRISDQYQPIGLNEIGFIEQIKLKVKTEVVYFEK